MKQILSIAFVLFFNTLLFSQIDLVPYRIKDKWGYSNFKGDIIINTKYDSVGFFKNIGRNINVAFVEKRNKIGIIDTKGKVLTPIKYKMIKTISYSCGCGYQRFLVKRKNKLGIIDYKNNRIIPIKYDTLFIREHDEYCNYFGKIRNQYFKFDVNGKKKSINEQIYKREKDNPIIEEEILAYSDDDISEANRWQLEFLSKNKLKKDSVSKVKVYACCNPFYFKFYYRGKVGIVSQSRINNKITESIVNPQFDSVIQYRFIYDDNSNEYYIFLIKVNDKIGVIDYKGNFLMPLKPFDYEYFNKNWICTKKGELFGFYNYKYKTDIAPVYEFIKHCRHRQLLKVKKNGKWGYINYKGFEYFRN